MGDERLSKYEFAIKLSKQFGLPVDLIQRNQVSNAPLLTSRPQDMSLDSSKVQQILGRGLGNVSQFLSILNAQEIRGRRSEIFKSINE